MESLTIFGIIPPVTEKPIQELQLNNVLCSHMGYFKKKLVVTVELLPERKGLVL
jgi:hypothetical protein